MSPSRPIVSSKTDTPFKIIIGLKASSELSQI